MECAVCKNARSGPVCAVCGFDAESAEARDPRAVRALQDAFRARSLRQSVTISAWDKWRPWVAVVLGFFLFATWMKACSSPGWPLWH